MSETHDIVVIGAGMAGLACAAACAAAGRSVLVLDKGRGLGGRLATRRGDRARFDHGAQYATAKGQAFAAYLDHARASGHVQVWQLERDRPVWVGVPGMSGLVRPLAQGLEVRCGVTVTGLRDAGGVLALETAAGALTARQIVCAIPAPQAQVLLRDFEGIDALSRVRIAPCWAALIQLAAPRPEWRSARLENDVLAWAARNTAKPGRPAQPECWVLHARPDWSRANLERDGEAVADDMAAAWRVAMGDPGQIAALQAHRWRYSMTETALGQPFLPLAHGRVLVGGDWCLGARVEAAFDSGQAMAAALMG
ncbi:MAG: FAD-dependent oxidoreductase [Pseudomonadota bacterium]